MSSPLIPHCHGSSEFKAKAKENFPAVKSMDTYMEIEFRYLEHSGLTFNGKIMYVMLRKEFKELFKFLETMVTGSCVSYIPWCWKIAGKLCMFVYDLGHGLYHFTSLLARCICLFNCTKFTTACDRNKSLFL
jgi:hypothetical protein